MSQLRGLASEQRLITLVGVGGTGKTRLLLELGAQLADRYADGIWLVELATITDPGLVASEIARVLGAQGIPGRSAADMLADFLGSKSLLLLIDNCEHLIGAVSDLVDDLLGACPNLAVMTSSREALESPARPSSRSRPWPCPSARRLRTSTSTNPMRDGWPRSLRAKQFGCSSIGRWPWFRHSQ